MFGPCRPRLRHGLNPRADASRSRDQAARPTRSSWSADATSSHLAIVQAVLDPAALRHHGGDGRSRTVIVHDPSFYEDAEETVRNATTEALASCRALGAKIGRKVAARNDEFLLVTA